MFILFFTNDSNKIYRDFGPYTDISIPTLILLEFQEKNNHSLHGYVKNEETGLICFTF